MQFHAAPKIIVRTPTKIVPKNHTLAIDTMASSESSSSSNPVDVTTQDVTVDEHVTSDITKTETEKAYNALGNNVRGLVILCRGLKKENGELLIDIAKEEPWSSQAREKIKPTNVHLKSEIIRRYNLDPLSVGKKPLCSSWTRDKVFKWLDDHPITPTEDVAFLREMCKTHKEDLEKAITATAREEALLQKNWTGPVPMLRLIHCVIDDRIKPAYLKRNDLSGDRLGVENRNSVVAQPNVYSLIADLWNNKDFEPETESLADLHDDFIVSQKLSYDKVASLAVADSTRVVRLLSQMRVSLNRIIGNWERSGQGDGGNDEREGENFGSLEGRSGAALHRRASFVEAKNSYLLYYWHMLEKHQLRASTFEKLPEGVGSLDGADSVPMSSVTTITARGAQKEHADDVALNRLSQSIDNLTKKTTLSELKRRLDDAQERTRAAKMKKFEAEHGPEERRFMVEFFSGQVNELEEKEQELSQQIVLQESDVGEDTETPRRRGGTPASAIASVLTS